MPLSEHEQQILEDIERHLQEQDPAQPETQPKERKLASAQRTNLKLGVSLFVIGVATLVGFFFYTKTFVGVAAFGLMVTGAVLFLRGAAGQITKQQKTGRPPRVSGLFDKVENRMREVRRRGGS